MGRTQDGDEVGHKETGQLPLRCLKTVMLSSNARNMSESVPSVCVREVFAIARCVLFLRPLKRSLAARPAKYKPRNLHCLSSRPQLTCARVKSRLGSRDDPALSNSRELNLDLVCWRAMRHCDSHSLLAFLIHFLAPRCSARHAVRRRKRSLCRNVMDIKRSDRTHTTKNLRQGDSIAEKGRLLLHADEQTAKPATGSICSHFYEFQRCCTS